MIAEVALDYTTFAPPLTVDDIRRDVDAYATEHLGYPAKIIVWVHQWDYLTKQYARLKPKYVVEKAEFDGFGINVTARPPESNDGGRIWGIRVEVRDPEAHKP